MLSFIDANIWGLLAMPLGVLFCFGPALVVWLASPSEKQEPQRAKKR